MRLFEPLRAATRLSLALFLLAGLAVFGGSAAISALAGPRLEQPAAQGGPGQGPFGTTAQNNATAFLYGRGYTVDGVGHPPGAGGGPDRSAVVAIMPFHSPRFDPGDLMDVDPETLRQVYTGLAAIHRGYPDAQRMAVALQWGNRMVMFPANTSTWRAAVEGTIGGDELWEEIEGGMRLIDATRYRVVDEEGFLTQEGFMALDFTNDDRGERGLLAPPFTLEQTPGLRLQVSSAYLPEGEQAEVIVSRADPAAAAAQEVELTYTLAGEEERPLLQLPLQADGTARGSFRLDAGLSGEVLLSAGAGGTPPGAALAIAAGPAVAGAAAQETVREALRLQGFDVFYAQYDDESGRATVLARAASQRFDDSVRDEILSIAGTVFTVYPGATLAEAQLLYRSRGTSYQLVYQVARQDWAAWMLAGSIGPDELWERIELDEVFDIHTGQGLGEREFRRKDFGIVGRREVLIGREIESSLVAEPWGEQLYTARLVVPIGARAGGFAIAERVGQAEFAIYSSLDPLRPVYDSAQDPGGLAGLSLGAGQYLLVVEAALAPASIRLTYVERLIDDTHTDL